MTVTGAAAGASPSGGVLFVPSSGGVVTLNYYDGRFLRADDLNTERAGQRAYADLSNRASGPGPVWGFDLTGLGTHELRLSAGLALSPGGKVLSLPDEARASMADLLAANGPSGGGASGGGASGGGPSGSDASGGGPAPAPGTGFTACEAAPAAAPGPAGSPVGPGTTVYAVRLSPTRGLRGEAEVFGRLCEGCVTATDSPYVVDGVTLELRPLSLDLQPWTAAGVTRPDLHLRSQVASAYFEHERQVAGPAMSAALLASSVWGAGAGSLAGDDGVLLGVLGWDGSTIVLLDPWTVRRESMQPPPSAYWGGRLERRPWPVFLAQVLQFQAQLAAAPPATGGSVQQLVDRGFAELPPAGYLPLPTTTADLRGILAAQFGPGVELRLSAVRQDQIPGEFERARHLERISLLRGLRDAAAREQVDVLVPDGLLAATSGGLEFAVDVSFGQGSDTALAAPPPAPRGTALGRGAARLRLGPGIDLRIAAATSMPRWGETFGRLLRGRQQGVSGFEAFLAGTRASPPVDPPDVRRLTELAGRVGAAAAGARTRKAAATLAVAVGDFRILAAEATVTVDADPFGLPDGGSTRFHAEASTYQPSGRSSSSALLQLSGQLVLVSRAAGGAVTVAATGVFGVTESASGGGSTGGTFENRSLVLTRTAGDGTTVTIADGPSGLTVEVHWTGDPARVDVAVRADGDRSKPPAAALAATQDPSVLRTGNTYHDSAASALAMVAAAHPDDPQHAEHAYQQLFPAGDAGVATVQAHRDWVLFRRRGRRDREGVPVVPVPADTVTAQVLLAKDAAEAATVVDTLLTGPAGDWPAAWTAAEVVFDGGTTTLLTPAAAWSLRYRGAGGADNVALAGYAPAAGSLGALVGTGRLQALLTALSPEVSTDPGAPVVPVNPPEALQPAIGTDGTAFLVTHPAAPAQVPLLAVRAVRTDGQDATIARLRRPDPTLVTDAAPFAALGEGGATTLDVDGVVTELATFVGDLQGGVVTVETLLWTYDPEPADVAADLAALATSVEAAVGGMPSTTVTAGTRAAVAFTRSADDLAAQLFLLVTVTSPIN